MCSGLGSAATNVHRDIYKAARSSLSGDRALHVRSAAATCIQAMASYCSFLYEAPNGMNATILLSSLNSLFQGFFDYEKDYFHLIKNIIIFIFRTRKSKW